MSASTASPARTHAQELFQAFQNSVNNNLSNFDNSFLTDDEEDYCPLCIEPLDITDKNFFPCPCGYQICQFCYNNIRQNPELNGRCPACRRKYDDESVRYVVLTPEELKMERANLARKERERKQREREKKESEYSNRRHLAGVRVIQKNLVYVVGVNPPVPYEEVANTLKSDKYFGQYGKINKIVVNRKNPHAGDNYHHHSPGYGVYITFASKDDAAKCIAQVDGTYMDGRLIKAAYGTTKYCSSYLRGLPCPNPNCMFLHEPGEEADSFNRRELHGNNKPQQSHGSPATFTTTAGASGNVFNKHLVTAGIGGGANGGGLSSGLGTGSPHTSNLISLNTFRSSTPSPGSIRAHLHHDSGTTTPVLTPAPLPTGTNPWGVNTTVAPVTSLNLSKNGSSNHLPSLTDPLLQHHFTSGSNDGNDAGGENNSNGGSTNASKKKNAAAEKEYVDIYDSLASAGKFVDERVKYFTEYKKRPIKLRSDLFGGADTEQQKAVNEYPSLFSWTGIESAKTSDGALLRRLVDILAIKPVDYSASVVQFLQTMNQQVSANGARGSNPMVDAGVLGQRADQTAGVATTQSPANSFVTPRDQVPVTVATASTVPMAPGLKSPSIQTNNSADLLNQLINGRRVVTSN